MDLSIYLNDVPVGLLRVLQGDTSEFRLHPSYKRMSRRPVLGQSFEDDLDREYWRSTLRLPPFFSNLLPEGRLRDLIAERADVSSEREFHLLAYLGQDLPGSVRAVADEVSSALEETAVVVSSAEPSKVDLGEPLRFSLAGLQLKFSMRQTERGLTLPASGKGGNWIVKLPDRRYERVPENEYAMMTWARAVGIEVPEFTLVPISELSGLPDDIGAFSKEKLCYAIRRFDRTAQPRRRIHIEDFAQVFGAYPTTSGKYGTTNYESVANVIQSTCGTEDVCEFARRLVFSSLCGNTDAHLKNWSLIYKDGIRARLSPAYDLVSTIIYDPGYAKNGLALRFNKTHAFEGVSLGGFRRLARKIKTDEPLLMQAVQSAAALILDKWTSLRSDLPLSKEAQHTIEMHLSEFAPLLL